MLRRPHCGHNTAVRCSQTCRQTVLCAVKIKHNLVICHIDLLIGGNRTACLHGEGLLRRFACRHSHLVQRDIIHARCSGCGGYSGCGGICRCCRRCRRGVCRRFDGNRSGCIIPLNVQIQCRSQRTHRQHRSVVYNHRRHIHGKGFAVFVASCLIHFKDQCVIIIDHIRLLGFFVPGNLAAKLLRNLAHGQKRSAVNRDRRHILRCHGFSVNLYHNLLRIVCVVLAVIKQVHADICCKCRYG